MHESIWLPWERSRRGLSRDSAQGTIEEVVCMREMGWARARLWDGEK